MILHTRKIFDEFEDFRENEVVSVDPVPLKDDELISLSEEEQDEIYQREEEAEDAESWDEGMLRDLCGWKD